MHQKDFLTLYGRYRAFTQSSWDGWSIGAESLLGHNEQRTQKTAETDLSFGSQVSIKAHQKLIFLKYWRAMNNSFSKNPTCCSFLFAAQFRVYPKFESCLKAGTEAFNIDQIITWKQSEQLSVGNPSSLRKASLRHKKAQLMLSQLSMWGLLPSMTAAAFQQFTTGW